MNERVADHKLVSEGARRRSQFNVRVRGSFGVCKCSTQAKSARANESEKIKQEIEQKFASDCKWRLAVMSKPVLSELHACNQSPGRCIQ